MVSILTYKKKVKNTKNGFIVRKYLSRVFIPVPPELTHELRVNGFRLTICGGISMTVAEIKQQVGFPCEVYYVKKGRKRRLNVVDRPFLKMYVLDHCKLNLLRDRKIVIGVLENEANRNYECIKKESGKDECEKEELYKWNGKGVYNLNQDDFRFDNQNKWIIVYAENLIYFYVRRIRKIVVCDIYLRELDMQEFHGLRYLRIENTGLSKIRMPGHRLFYCNLSRNRLETVVVNSDVLILQRNNLRVFVSPIWYKYLNCSNNPLKRLKCGAEVINVRYCQLKHPLNTNARRIMADYNKCIRLGVCREVVNLSITYCGVKTLPELPELRYLKARGNCLQRLTGMDRLEYVDVEDNFLMQLSCHGAKYLNVAKNIHVDADWEKHKLLQNINVAFTNIDTSLINKIINRNKKTNGASRDSRICNNYEDNKETRNSNICNNYEDNKETRRDSRICNNYEDNKETRNSNICNNYEDNKETRDGKDNNEDNKETRDGKDNNEDNKKTRDGKDNSNYTSITTTPRITHNCRRYQSFVKKYTIPFEIRGCPARLIVVLETNSQENHTELLQRMAETAGTRHTVSVHLFDWLVCETDKCFGRHRAAYALVTPNVVLVSNKNLPVLCVNFGETICVSSQTETLGFCNVSLWRVIPLFCPLARGAERRLYKVQKEYAELGQIFEFLGYFCTLSLKFTIENSLAHLNNHEVPGENNVANNNDILGNSIVTCDNTVAYDNTVSSNSTIYSTCQSRNRTHSAASFKQVLEQMSTFDKEILTYGYGILDFGNNFYLKKYYSSFITVTDPVFIFIKLLYGSTIDPVVAFDEHNIMNLMDVYVKAFSARYIEKSCRFCILGFNSPLAAVLWALRMRKTFSVVGVSVSIGIVKGTVFRSEHDGRLVYGGPVFNKVSRISDLGTGIFMSDDFIISHPLVYTVDEGKMLLKGFTEPIQIYSLHLKSWVI